MEHEVGWWWWWFPHARYMPCLFGWLHVSNTTEILIWWNFRDGLDMIQEITHCVVGYSKLTSWYFFLWVRGGWVSWKTLAKLFHDSRIMHWGFLGSLCASCYQLIERWLTAKWWMDNKTLRGKCPYDSVTHQWTRFSDEQTCFIAATGWELPTYIQCD